MAYSFSLWFAFIYLNLTGNSKGYSYDLGADKDISILLGGIELLLWFVLSIPSDIYLVKKTYSKGIVYTVILFGFYIVLAFVGLLMIFGSWTVYLKGVFNIQI